MKKLFLVAVLAAFGFSNANAQELKFGAKAGVNFASLGGDDSDGFSGITSFHVGGVVNIGVSERFSVQPELVYNCLGGEYTESEGYDGKYKLGYLSIPIIANFEVADGLSVQAGPQVSFLMSAMEEYNSDGDSGEEDIKEFLKGNDFGASIGLAYQMESGLNFSARYNLGLSNIADYDNGDLKVNAIQVSVGYMFN